MPYGTRCHAIALVDDEVHVWIALNTQRSDDYSKWQGTFLRIDRRGNVSRVTVDDELDYDPEFIVREGKK